MKRSMKYWVFGVLLVGVLLWSGFGLWFGQVGLEPFEGEGTEASPYLIETPEDLEQLARLVNSSETNEDYSYSVYKQTAELDMSTLETNVNGSNHTPIGTNEYPFRGTYNGQNFAIHNLMILESSMDYVGLFGCVEYLDPVVIENVSLASGRILGAHFVGGVVGNFLRDNNAIKGEIRGCRNACSVEGFQEVGGIAGKCYADMRECSNSGNIAGTQNTTGGYIGGLIGSLYGSCISCSNSGSVEGYSKVGGVLGYVIRSNGGEQSVYSLMNSGSVTGSSQYTGGVVGQSDQQNMKYVANKGKVKGVQYVGGVCGQITIGDIASITQLINLAEVRGVNNVGGIVGDSTGSLEACYSIGNVEGTTNTNVGAVFGALRGTNTVRSKNCYYNKDTCKIGAVAGEDRTTSNMIGLDTLQMTGSLKEFVGFDSDIWIVDNDGEFCSDDNKYATREYYYPRLGELLPALSKADVTVTIDYFNFGQVALPEWDRYKVVTKVEELQAIENDLDCNYVIEQDIAIPIVSGDESNFVSIGTVEEPFCGKIDGNGHSIQNLTIQQTEGMNCGLIGAGEGMLIRNLSLQNAAIQSNANVGAVCGNLKSGRIQNCHVSGRVSGLSSIAGVVGEAYDSIIKSCSNYSAVTGQSVYVGGIVGSYKTTDLQDCYNAGDIAGNEKVGGIAGYCAETGEVIKNCYNIGVITGNNDIGYMIGVGNGQQITNCYNNSEICDIPIMQDSLAVTEGALTTAQMTGQESVLMEALGSIDWTCLPNEQAENIWTTDTEATAYYPQLKGSTVLESCQESVDYKVTVAETQTVEYGDDYRPGVRIERSIRGGAFMPVKEGTLRIDSEQINLMAASSIYQNEHAVQFSYCTTDKKLVPRESLPITLSFSGDSFASACSKTVSFTLRPRALTAIIDATKMYDGNKEFSGVTVAFDTDSRKLPADVITMDDASFSVSGSAVGGYTTVNEFVATLEGRDCGFYQLQPSGVQAGTIAITKRPLVARAPNKRVQKCGDLPELSNTEIQYEGFIQGEDEVKLRIPECALEYQAGTTTEDIGDYDIYLKDIEADNYELQYTPGKLSVVEAPSPTPGESSPTPGESSPTPGESSPTPGVSSPTPGVSSPTPGVSSPTPGENSPTPGVNSPTPGVSSSTPIPGALVPTIVLNRLSANEKDSEGATFMPLRFGVVKAGKNSLTLKWSKMAGVENYLLYGSRCGKDTPLEYIASYSGQQTKASLHKLKKGSYYKFCLVAVRSRAEKPDTMAISRTIHVPTTGGKYTDVKKLQVNSRTVLKKGKKQKLKFRVVKGKKKGKLQVHVKPSIRYETSNSKVATVNSKGVIKTVGRGSCTICVYAQNGVFKLIKMKVK